MTAFSLFSAKRVHIIGIGGIGLSALAQYFVHRGARVTGSDSSESPIVARLQKQGIVVHIGHRADQIPPDADLALYSIAVAKDNPELLAAQNLGIETRSYPEGLAELTRTHETIAVSGTHGKTTTTAMLAEVLIEAKLDPTVVVGSLMYSAGSNLIIGNGKHLVLEADEYRRSFLNYFPKILVITNIDLDHLDYYRDLADIQSAFRAFAERLPESGTLVANAAHPTIAPIVEGLSRRVVNWRNFLPEAESLDLQVFGKHNVWNAACVLAVADMFGISSSTSHRALNSFKGTWRRIEEKGTTQNGITVYDDYGHNPTEVAITLSALRAKFPMRHITVLFQPHLYSRTKLQLDDFAKSFGAADLVLVADIYAARETPDPSISGEILARAIGNHHSNVRYVGNLSAALALLPQVVPKGSIFLTQSAGDVYKVGEAFLAQDRMNG